MALPSASAVPSLSPQVVGNAFVEQYYHVLHRSPELVYRFYQDTSVMSRLDSNGVMTSVTSTQAINNMVLSIDYKNYITEILTADSQPSYKDGVLILVTGCLTGQDKIQRKFSQSFFLAPQDNGGYFVLNDMFRFVNESRQREASQIVNASNDVPVAPLTPELGLDVPVAPLTPELVASVHDPRAPDPASPLCGELLENGEEACELSENGGSVVEEEISMDQPVHPRDADTVLDPETTSSVVQEDLSKKSYASIVKVVKGCTTMMPIYVPITKARAAPADPQKMPSVPATKEGAAPANPEKPPTPAKSSSPAPEIPTTSDNNTSETNNSYEDKGHSIYIRNLPLNATASQIEEEFKKFGRIKPGGVQVRSHKMERFCFGFVEFDSLDSMQVAIEASPVMIGGRHVSVEEKKTTTRVVNGVVSNGNGGNGRGRYPSARGVGGFRNDNFRARGGFGGNQVSIVRNEFRNNWVAGDYSGRSRAPPPGRAGGSYQRRVVQNGYGSMGRPDAMNQATVAA